MNVRVMKTRIVLSGLLLGFVLTAVGSQAAAQSADPEGSACTTDADGDGVIAIACGGYDCDDSDSRRYPGHTEVCDAQGVDEDCDLSTPGFLDTDGDGDAPQACWNADASRACDPATFTETGGYATQSDQRYATMSVCREVR